MKMGSSEAVFEICESIELQDKVFHLSKSNTSVSNLKEIGFDESFNQLSVKNFNRQSLPVLGLSRSNLLNKCALKKGIGIPHMPKNEILESLTLKQALRSLCISHAARMAALKRLSPPHKPRGSHEIETIEKLYASVVLHDKGTDPSSGRRQVVIKSSVVGEGYTDLTMVKDSIESTDLTMVKDTKESAESSSAVDVIRMKGKVLLKTFTFGSEINAELRKVGMGPGLKRTAWKRKFFDTRNERHLRDGKYHSSVKSNETKMNRLKDSFSPSCNSTSCNHDQANGVEVIETYRSKERGECSQSSKSSNGDYCSSSTTTATPITTTSDDRCQLITGRNSSRPHMRRDARWIAINCIVQKHDGLDLKDFILLNKLGCGDIGIVYLAKLAGSDCLYALKVVDMESLSSRKKLRAQTEREILQMLDHPFLPTLYAHFTSDNLSCLVMEYCSGGNLHLLRHKQAGMCFSESAARFYVAEVLLALEYLHMLGVIYRDLQPENILIREDGHIMLSGFDLSLRCTVNPTLLDSSSLTSSEAVKRYSFPCTGNSCLNPSCLLPSWVPISCFRPQPLSAIARNTKLKPDYAGQVFPLPQLVVEPIAARSNSLVGTHEYLAPEIILGNNHGSAVDWWMLGIFLYELLFSRTPFKGCSNEEMLTNVVSEAVKFPDSSSVSIHAKDLIEALLVKEPENRLGFASGAAEIKQHSFFEGINWALIRCLEPPEMPRSYEVGDSRGLNKSGGEKFSDF